MTATGVQLRDVAVAKRGYRYEVGPTRTTGADGYFDCSGLVFYAATQCGLHIPNISWTIALFCNQNGTEISIAEALRTPGALIFKGPNAGEASSGVHGHVAICIGDGVNVIEAKGHAWGVLVDNQANNSADDPWTFAALLPGIDYGPVVLPPPVRPVVVPPPVTVSISEVAMHQTDLSMKLDSRGDGHVPVSGVKAVDVHGVFPIAVPDPAVTGSYTPVHRAALTIGTNGFAEIVVEGGLPNALTSVRVLHD